MAIGLAKAVGLAVLLRKRFHHANAGDVRVPAVEGVRVLRRAAALAVVSAAALAQKPIQKKKQ